MAFESPDTRASLILRLPDAADVAAWDEFVALYGPLLNRLARRHGLQAADSLDDRGAHRDAVRECHDVAWWRRGDAHDPAQR